MTIIYNVITKYFFEKEEGYREQKFLCKSFAKKEAAKEYFKKEIKKVPQVWNKAFDEEGKIKPWLEEHQENNEYFIIGEDCFTEYYEINIEETPLL